MSKGFDTGGAGNPGDPRSYGSPDNTNNSCGVNPGGYDGAGSRKGRMFRGRLSALCGLMNPALYRLLCFAAVMAVSVSCVEKTDIAGDGDTGGGDGPGRGIENLVSIAYLKTLYNYRPRVITEDVTIEGVITANDRNGNLPYTAIVEDATGAVEIKLSGRQLFVDFPVRHKMLVRCQGLVLGSYGGLKSLGTVSNDPAYENGFIPEASRSYYFDITPREAKPEPLEIFLGSITDRDVSRYVCIENVQFEETGVLWCDEDTEAVAVATDRHLVNPAGDRLVVRTAATADFALESLPAGNGYIEGILGVFNGKYQLTVVDKRFVVMEGKRF